LGLHGHQHVAQAAAHYIHVPEQQAMAVVSAGSLCAGLKELPRGVNRQYNIIEIGDDYCSALVHAREMGAGEHFCKKGNDAFAIDGQVQLNWERPIDISGRPIDAAEQHRRKQILEAEQLVQTGQTEQAFDLLSKIPVEIGSLNRQLSIDAAVKLKKWNFLVATIEEPANAEELVNVVIALQELDRIDEGLETLRRDKKRVGLAEHVFRELEDRLLTLRRLRGPK
jgi:hypothetical protein